ncbi:MAG TPA: hypothetical protein VFX31_14800, partial [Ktedonobacterales bacterium]|nr:hypothetical protein [Ktedonobacterales bacterium]
MQREELLDLTPRFAREPIRMRSNFCQSLSCRQTLARGPVVAKRVELPLGRLAPERILRRALRRIIVEPEILRAGRVNQDWRAVGF